MKKPLILGHRGYRARFPENTMLAFQKALEYGAHGFECDIQKSADGLFAVIHDETIDRTSSEMRTGAVKDMTFASLAKTVVGGGETIPEFGAMIRGQGKTAFINVELKHETVSKRDCSRLYDIISKKANTNRIMISSFNHELLPYFIKKKCITGMLVTTRNALRHPLAVYRDACRLKPSCVNLPVNILSFLFLPLSLILIKALRRRGFGIVFWTANSPVMIKRAAVYGDIIITDEVERAVRLLS